MVVVVVVVCMMYMYCSSKVIDCGSSCHGISFTGEKVELSVSNDGRLWHSLHCGVCNMLCPNRI